MKEFHLIPGPDNHACIFCPMHGANSLYYPPRELLEFAGPEVPLQRVRVCQNHYSNVRSITARDTGMPKSFESLYRILLERNLISDKRGVATLPGWKLNEDATRMYNGYNSAEPQYYNKFEAWVRSESIMFRGIAERLEQFQWFLNEYPEMDVATIKAFEAYLHT
jgi:hypothetical protein